MPFNSRTASEAGKASSRKGSPNKETQLLRERVKILLDDNWDSLGKDIKGLSGKDRIDTLLRLLEFALPKLARTEFGEVTDIEDLLRMKPKERQSEIVRLRQNVGNDK